MTYRVPETPDEARQRGEPTYWKDRLRLGLPLLPIAGGTNVTQNLTGSGLAHIDGLFTFTAAQPDKNCDMSDGGRGAQFVPVLISFGHDRPMGRGWPGYSQRACYLQRGGFIQGGRVGANKLPDGTEVLQVYVPASWREVISWGEETPPEPPPPAQDVFPGSIASAEVFGSAKLNLNINLVSIFEDNFNRADSNSLGSGWSESENTTASIRISSNQILLRTRITNLPGSSPDAGIAKVVGTFPNNQSAEARFGSTTGVDAEETGPAVRLSGTFDSATAYVAFYAWTTELQRIELWRIVNYNLLTRTGSVLVLGDFVVTLVAGDKVRIEALGTSIKVYVNDVERISAVDSNIAVGSPGMAAVASTNGSDTQDFQQTWDDFRSVAGLGIASSEAFGTPKLNLNIAPTGIASAEALGTPKLNLQVVVPSIGSAEAFGSARLNLEIDPAGGIGSLEAFGTARLNLEIDPVGAIPSGEAFGNPTVSVGGAGGPQTVAPNPISSLEAFGLPTLSIPLPVGDSIGTADGRGTMKVDERDALNAPKRQGQIASG